MLSRDDLHCHYVRQPMPGDAGVLQIEYQVRRFTDVRNLEARRGYHISARQRVILPNNGAALMGASQVTQFVYTVLLTVNTYVVPGATMSDYYLLDVSPRTLNAAVSTNISGGVAQSGSTTTTHTTGSSDTTVNSYEFGIPTFSKSKSDTDFNANSSAGMKGHSSNASMSDSMTVKDWSSYVSVDPKNRDPAWVWAQTFPWDVIQYHYTDPEGVVTLPQSAWMLLFPPKASDPTEGNPALQLVNPPSQIALFGLDFVSRAEWIYLVDGSDPVDSVEFTHVVAPHTGSHGFLTMPPVDPTVRLTQASGSQLNYVSPKLDLAQLALDPINDESAVVGFVASQFVTKPNNPGGFAILSTANTLLIRGVAGQPFADPVSNDAPMTVDLADPQVQAGMSVSFKIADEDADRSLYLKHWKTGAVGVRMTIVINGGAPVVRHIESAEAGSGSDNVMRVYLRRKSFNSDEYFDYLVPGLNTVTITVAADFAGPPTASPVLDCGYAIRALAIT